MSSEQPLTVRWGRMHALRYLTPGLVGLVLSGGLLVQDLPEALRVVCLVVGVPSVLLVIGLSPFLVRPWTALTLDKEQIRLHRVLRPDIAVRCSDVVRAEITHVFRVGPVLLLYLRSDAPGSRFAPADHGVILEDLGMRPHEFAALLEQYCDLSKIRVDYSTPRIEVNASERPVTRKPRRVMTWAVAAVFALMVLVVSFGVLATEYSEVRGWPRERVELQAAPVTNESPKESCGRSGPARDLTWRSLDSPAGLPSVFDQLNVCEIENPGDTATVVRVVDQQTGDVKIFVNPVSNYWEATIYALLWALFLGLAPVLGMAWLLRWAKARESRA